ncbi:MAG: DUF4292 domain-containing protein [Bacteroidia bacterium]|nr:MAG: DUF4292 domain-containing protein [Bacteroidia bacterium]
MSRIQWILGLLALFLLQECGALKELSVPTQAGLKGMAGLEESCQAQDTIRSILISKAEAILTFDNERYEVEVTIYSLRDSFIYLSAVNSGYEILRASVMKDSIKVINRLDKIVYRSPLERKYGYQYPVNFRDLQNLISRYYLCNDLESAHDDHMDHIVFEFDEPYVKKRIHLDREGLLMKTFEFYHQQTNKYLMGERQEDAFRIYSNFMITEFEIVARGGVSTYNRDIKIKMDVNPRRYTFTELR